jgi:hypothetical protein
MKLFPLVSPVPPQERYGFLFAGGIKKDLSLSE